MKIFLIPALASLLASCTFDSAGLRPNVAPCDTADSSSYVQDIVPILAAKCYSCHTGTSSSSGIALDTYSDLSGYSSGLPGNIRHLSGYNAMPPLPAPKLSPCEIRTIERWIEAGAPEN